MSLVRFAWAFLGLSALVFAGGASAEVAQGGPAPAVVAAKLAEKAGAVKEGQSCPAPQAEVDPKRCEELPIQHGLSPKYLGEWGIASTEMNPTYIRRLACADGSDARIDAIRGRADRTEDGSRLLRWRANCSSKTFTIFASEDRCGDPCPPAGFRLLSAEALAAIDRVAPQSVGESAQVVRAGVEEMRRLAPEFERVYLLGYRRLMDVGLEKEAHELAAEGLKRFPSSQTLGWVGAAAPARVVGASTASLRYSRDPADTEIDRCDALPPDFGFSKVHPLEYADVALERLICADGTSPTKDRYGSTIGDGSSTSPTGGWTSRGKEPPSILDSWSIGCDSRFFHVYVSNYRSGRPCAPKGLRLLPQEVFDLQIRSGRFKREGDIGAAFAELERARALAPGVESNYLRLLDLLDFSTELDRALVIVSEGVRGVPESNRLRRHRAMLLLRSGRAEEALAEFDEILRRLDRAGDQRMRALTLCMKSKAVGRLGRVDEEKQLQTEACAWGQEDCCKLAAARQ